MKKDSFVKIWNIETLVKLIQTDKHWSPVQNNDSYLAGRLL